MRMLLAIMLLLPAALASAPASAAGWHGAGWYRVVQRVAGNGRVLDEFLDHGGPWQDESSCRKGMGGTARQYVRFCEYYPSDPDVPPGFVLASRIQFR